MWGTPHVRLLAAAGELLHQTQRAHVDEALRQWDAWKARAERSVRAPRPGTGGARIPPEGARRAPGERAALAGRR